MNKKISILTGIFALAWSAYSIDKISYYQNNFEEEKDDDIEFRAAAFPWSTSLKKMEAEGKVKIHRMGLSDSTKKLSHGGGTRSYFIDVTLDKCTPNWGARAMWTTKKTINPIKLDKPVYFTGFALPEELPPDTSLKFGVIYDGITRKTGEAVKNGCIDFENIGVDADGWQIFQKNISDLLVRQRGVDNAVITGWQITITSPHAFHGQRVKAYFDDISITNYTQGVNHAVSREIAFKETIRTSKNNMLPGNTSFECGDENWNMQIDRSVQAADGLVCLKMPDDRLAVWSKPYYGTLEVDTPYTCSFYAKASKESRLSAGIFGSSHELFDLKTFNLDRQWHRFTLQVPADAAKKLKNYAAKNEKNAKYGIKFLFKKVSPDVEIWLDAIQINPGSTALPFEPGNDISAAINTPPCHKGVLPVSPKPIDLKIDLYNARETPANISAKINVFNYYGHCIWNKTFEAELKPGKILTKSIPVETLNQEGFFNAELHVYEQDKEILEGECSFVTVTKPLVSADHFMGLHPNKMLQHDIDALDMVGVDAVRVFFHSWIAISAGGKWQFTWDLEPYVEKNMLPLTSTMWEWKKTSEIDFQTQLNNYVEFCRQLVRKYGSQTKYWEIENEPNGTMPAKMGITHEDAANFYAQVLREASRAIKEIQPDAVISVGLSGWDHRFNYLWYRTILTKAKDSFDVIAVHPYADQRLVSSENTDMGPEDIKLKQKIEKVQDLIKEYNGKQQVWVGEIGWVLTCLEPVISEPSKRHARYLARTFILAKAAGAKRVFYFIEEGVYEKHGFAFGLWLGDKQPRPAVAAYATIARIIGDSKFIKPIIENGYQFTYLFEKNGKPFAALWQHDKIPAASLTLKAKPDEIRLVDIMNNPVQSIEPQPGKITVPLSGDPVFVFSDKLTTEQLAERLVNGEWSVSPVRVAIYLNSDKGVSCKISNNYQQTIQYGQVSISSANLSFVPSSCKVTLPPGGDITCNFTVPEATSLQGENSITLDIKTNKGQLSKTFETNLTACQYKTIKLQSSFEEACKGLNPIILDNRLFILPPDPFVEWKGKDDLSVKAYTAWDEKNFYFLADVTDDIHCQKQPQEKLWASDSIQMAFDTLANAEEGTYNYDGDDVEFTLANSNGRSLWNVTEGTLKNNAVPDIIVTRKNNHTYYKCAVPWSTLSIDAKVGKVYGFNFIVNEDDGSGRFHFMGMTPGIGEKKYPYLFKKFYLAR